MALYPKAVLRLLAPDALDPRIDPTQAVLHIDAGNATSLYGWWKTNGVNECHFFVKKDGVVEQYVDTKYQADAQVGGASKAISIETQGYDAGTWTPAQLASIKALLTWINQAHPKVKLRPPANPYDAGVGYHSMWASTREGTWARDGRTCPGTDRVKQYRTVLVPWMSNPTPAGGFLMALTDKQQTDLYNRVMGSIPAGRASGNIDSNGAPARLLDSADGGYLVAKIAAGQVDVAKLAAAVVSAMPAGAVTDAQLEAALRKVLGSVDGVTA